MPRVEGERPPAIEEPLRAVPVAADALAVRRVVEDELRGAREQGGRERDQPVAGDLVRSRAPASGPGRRPRSDAPPPSRRAARRPCVTPRRGTRSPGRRTVPGRRRWRTRPPRRRRGCGPRRRSATTCGVPRVTMAPIREDPLSRRPANGTGDVSSRADIPPAECPMTSTGAPPDSVLGPAGGLEERTPGPGEDRPETPGGREQPVHRPHVAHHHVGRPTAQEPAPERPVERRRGQEPAQHQHDRRGRSPVEDLAHPRRRHAPAPGAATATGARASRGCMAS